MARVYVVLFPSVKPRQTRVERKALLESHCELFLEAFTLAELVNIVFRAQRRI